MLVSTIGAEASPEKGHITLITIKTEKLSMLFILSNEHPSVLLFCLKQWFHLRGLCWMVKRSKSHTMRDIHVTWKIHQYTILYGSSGWWFNQIDPIDSRRNMRPHNCQIEGLQVMIQARLFPPGHVEFQDRVIHYYKYVTSVALKNNKYIRYLKFRCVC